MVNLLHPYFHSFDFPYHDELLKMAESIKQEWDSRIGSIKGKGYNLTIENYYLRKYLEDKILDIILDEYNLSAPTTPQAPAWMYIQDNKNNASVWHRHCFKQHMPGLVCSTYINPPNEGGEFEFIGDDPTNPIKITPEKNKLYVFPPWLLHRPLSQKDTTTRYCLTYQYVSDRKITHPQTQIVW